jgi:hypothetical protein
MRNAYKGLRRGPGGKRPLGRPKSRWEDNIKCNLGKMVGWCGLDSCGSGSAPMTGWCE